MLKCIITKYGNLIKTLLVMNMKFKVKQVTDYTKINFDKLCDWMFNWWGKSEGKSKEWVEHYMQHSFNKNSLPFTIIAFNEQNEEVAMCQVTMHDLEVRPDIYPYVANLFVQNEYRGNGLVNMLLKKALSVAQKIGVYEIYIYTEHVGLYEKYGWEFVGEIDTFLSPRIQRLYKINIDKK